MHRPLVLVMLLPLPLTLDKWLNFSGLPLVSLEDL